MKKCIFVIQIMLVLLFFISMDTSAQMVDNANFKLCSPLTPSELIGIILITFEAVIKLFPKLRKFSLVSKLIILSDVIDKHKEKITRYKSIKKK